MKFKIYTLLLITGFAFLTSCNNDDDNDSEIKFESTATITGLDLTLCACCGGWIIDIDGEDPDKRFTELPKDSNINLDVDALPISVELNWSESDEYCGKGITIESIKSLD